MARTFTLFSALLLAVSLIVGCVGEPRPAGMPRLYPVSITVTQEGEPLEGALLQLFAEDSANARWGPSGVSNSSGVATLFTEGKYKGVPLGEFKVVVTKSEREPHPHPEWADLPYGDPNFQRYGAISRGLKTFNYVELQYGSVADTPLSIDITAGKKTYTIDVGKQSKTEVRANQ